MERSAATRRSLERRFPPGVVDFRRDLQPHGVGRRWGRLRRPARRHDDDIGLRGPDRVPRRRHRLLPWSGGDGSAAARRDEVRHPVPRREGRVDPFDHRDLRRRPPVDRRGDSGQPLTCFGDDRLGPRAHTGPLAHRDEGGQHVVERVRIERHHVGLAAQVVQRVLNMVSGQRAHAAQVLRQDELRASAARASACSVYRSRPASS